MESASPEFVFASALGAGVVGQVVARHLHVPSIVPLLALGVLLGPDLLGWVHPRALGEGLLALVEVAVAIILFEGGLNLDLRRLRRENRPIRMLVTAGALVTAVGGALAARLAMGWSWELSLLFGTLVIVTGPTVIGPLVRNVSLRPRLATVLEAEGVLIDPIGAIVAAVTLPLVTGGTPGIEGLLAKLGFGATAGLVLGLGLAAVLRARRIVPEGLENIVTLGGALVIFEFCNELVSESGILAVTLAGVVVGNANTRVSRELREFQEHLTIGLIGILFVLLAADVRIADVTRLGWSGLATVAALVLVVRPLNVMASTPGSELSGRERAFLCWIAPRGIVAAAVASLFAEVMDQAGVAGGTELRALVFLTIAVTVVVQGGTGGLVARLLGVRTPGRESLAILGGEELGLVLAETLRERDERPIVFLDANPMHIRAAQDRGFAAVYGNALEERTLARARFERMRAVIGVTPSDQVNSLFAREAAEEFGVPESFVAVNRSGTRVSGSILEKQGSHVLFDRPKDVERWSVRLRHGQARVAPFDYAGPEDPEAAAAEAERGGGSVDPYILMVLERTGVRTPYHTGVVPRLGDRAWVALHVPEADAAAESLRRIGWVPAAERGTTRPQPPARDDPTAADS